MSNDPVVLHLLLIVLGVLTMLSGWYWVRLARQGLTWLNGGAIPLTRRSLRLRNLVSAWAVLVVGLLIFVVGFVA